MDCSKRVRGSIWTFLAASLLTALLTPSGVRAQRATVDDPPAQSTLGRRVLLETDGGATSLVFQESPGSRKVEIQRSNRPITSPRLTKIDSAGVLFASWDENESGGSAHNVSISKDGGTRWSRPQAITYDIPLRGGRLIPGVSATAVAADLTADSNSRLYIVQFETVGLAAWRERLRALGAEVLSYLPEHSHIVRMSSEVAAKVRQEEFVRWVGPYHHGYKLHPDIVRDLSRGGPRPPGHQRYVLQTFTPGPDEKSILAAEVKAVGGEVVAQIPHGYMLEANLTLDQVARLAPSEHLLWVDFWSSGAGDMDIVRSQTGANYIEGVAGYSGQGVRGEVLDDGIMNGPVHPDHDGVMFHGATPPKSDHGTCTYGILFGNGSRDGDGLAQATGMLPSGQGIFASWQQLTDRYQLTAELVQSPYFAVLQSNSWGTANTSAYNPYSFQMDDIIWLNDILILNGMSNTQSRICRPESWAKNVIAVGGVHHFDTETLTDDCWRCPAGSRNWSGNGPADDGRIKPDLVHWYDWVFTTDREPGGWVPGSPYYDDFHGTSSATPICAGVAGLIFQMWADDVWGTHPSGTTVFEKRPHFTTVKALLINSAIQYPFAGTESDFTRNHQGWGLPNAKRAYDRAPLTKIVNEDYVLNELDVDRYTATVPAGQPELKVTMTYADRAGTTSSTLHRINDVTLKVTAPDGTVYWGNKGLDVGNWSVAGGGPDTRNTVENVFLQNPAPGNWTVEISADEINQDVHAETPGDDQDYALVVYGVTSLSSCRAAAQEPTSIQVTPQGSNVIQISWTGSPGATEYKVYRAGDGCSGNFQLLGTVPAPGTSFTDTSASGGLSYSYRIRSVETCESYPSACAQATTTGPCTITPAFAGVGGAASADSSTCGINLSWPAATPSCGGPIQYNVYRSTSSFFIPSASNRIAQCLSGPTYLDSLALSGGQTYYYVVRAEDLGGRPDGVCSGMEEGNSMRLATRPFGTAATLLDTNFETSLEGWVPAKGSPAASKGDFIAGDPKGTFNGPVLVQPEDDHTPAGTRCLYTAANPLGDYNTDDVDGGEVMATSPVFDGAGFASVRLKLWRWHYNNEINSDPGDYFKIDLSNNGGSTWTNLETLGQAVRENFWVERRFDLESFAPPTSSMAIRVRSADGLTHTNILESAIDDVLVQGLQVCTTATVDNDGDGYLPPEDCNDANPAIHPGALEACDGVDNNCNGTRDEGFDADMDGYSVCDGDCNDTDPAIHPGATEICDGVDDDCDTQVDESGGAPIYQDADNDGYGSPSVAVTSCTPPPGYIPVSGDCDDADPAVNPGQIEIPGNGKDDDCNALTTDGNAPPAPPSGVTLSQTSSPETALMLHFNEGIGYTTLDSSSSAATGFLGNTTDGDSKEPLWQSVGRFGLALLFDGVNDHVRVANSPALSMAGSFTVEAWVARTFPASGNDDIVNKGETSPRNYRLMFLSDNRIKCGWDLADGTNQDSTSVSTITDTVWHHLACVHDVAAGVNRIFIDGVLDIEESRPGPPATNTSRVLVGAADTTSNDAFHGLIDEVRISSVALYGATFIPPAGPFGVLQNRLTWTANTEPDVAGYRVYRSLTPGGPYARISPPMVVATQFGDSSQSAVTRYYVVTAVNGNGNESAFSSEVEGGPTGPPVDSDGDGHLSDVDCDDNDPAVNSGRSEVAYNEKDDDCAAVTRDDDLDLDGHALASDCNDGDPAINPGVFDTSCNGVDENCNGAADEGYVYHPTNCGLGACQSTGTAACVAGAIQDSCVPGTPVPETCDGIDNDCDGTVDNGVTLTWYADTDGDGYGNAAQATQACSQPVGHAGNALDCNDLDSGSHHPVSEVESLDSQQVGSVLHMIWPGQASSAGSGTVYDLVTSTLSQLLSSGGFGGAICLAPGLASSSYDDTRPGPAMSDAYYYLVRAKNSCGAGTFGDSTRIPDPRDALDGSPPCP